MNQEGLRMTRRDFLKCASVGATAAWAMSGSASTPAPVEDVSEKPNVILIMVDDMGYSDVGCYGGEIETPNIDRLADEGVRFTQFYNCARCIPTRASLLTGLYPQQVKTTGEGRSRAMQNCVTLAEVLKSAGYRTLMTGKWHNPETPVARGFDRYYGLVSGCCNYFNPGLKRPGENEPGRKRPGEQRPWAIDDQIIQPYTPEDKNFYTTDAFTDQALEYLDQYGQEDRPFFLYLPYTAPHFPIQAWPEDIAKYRGKYKIGWDVIRERRYERMLEMGLLDSRWALSQRDPRAPAWEDAEDKDGWDLKMAVYAAMIDRVDQNIGRLLQKLYQLGKEDNTLVLFLSDNGACSEDARGFPSKETDIPPGPMESYRTVDLPWANASDTPFRKFKLWTHEGGIATPLIARWPKVIEERGTLTRQVGHVMDIMPTLCEIAGASYPETYNDQTVLPVEGKSLLPVLVGEEREGHDVIYWEDLGNRAVRQGKWKIVAAKGESWELYDLEEDRSETTNLAGQFPDKVERMAGMWDDWAERTG